MSSLSFNGSAFVLAAAMIACASSVGAQRAAGPFSGVLGAVEDADATHTLDVRGSLFGSWDDTLSITQPDTVDPRFLQSGAAAGVSGSLSHARRSSRFTWQSGANTSMRLSGTQSDAFAATFGGQTSLTTSVSRRISISGSLGLSYSPFYDFAPGFDSRLSNVGAFGGGFGAATAAERNVNTTGGAGMNIRASRRDTFDVSGNARRSEFLDQADSQIDFWDVGARWNHAFTRSLGVHAGFFRQEAKYGSGSDPSATSDNIDVGVDYNDTLAFALSRRTALTFATSTSLVRWNDRTNFRLNGSAVLTRSFSRSGSASLSYVRTTSFDAGFREPLLQDGVTAGVSNQLNRRATWSAQAGYQHGGIGFQGGGSVNSYNAGGGVNVALTRRIGVFTDYSFYQYKVPAGSTVFTSLSEFSRQSVTAGLSVWAPLIADKRSSRDSR